jgi:hypothetical protein
MDARNGSKVDQWKTEVSRFHNREPPGVVLDALSEFGGIRMGFEGPGLECARGSFEIDPSLAIGEEDRFALYSRQVGADVFPLGEVLEGNAFLGMDEKGRVFLVGDQIALLGNDIYAGLEALLLGLSPLALNAD